MYNVLRSLRLDHMILKSNFKAFIAVYFVATMVGITSKIPYITVLVVMIISAPFIGTYFSIYEKNGLDRLYGILPIKRIEIVVGRYLYVAVMGVVAGIIAGVLALGGSLIIGKITSFTEYLSFFSVAFMCYCLLVGIVFPLYFRFSFSKVYMLANFPMYICAIIIFFLIKRTNILISLGDTIRYFTAHQYMIWISGIVIGLILLSISCTISYTVSKKK